MFLTNITIKRIAAFSRYVFWDQHESVKGIYNFDDNNDLVAFIQLAQKIGFLVILRVGPYVIDFVKYNIMFRWL